MESGAGVADGMVVGGGGACGGSVRGVQVLLPAGVRRPHLQMGELFFLFIECFTDPNYHFFYSFLLFILFILFKCQKSIYLKIHNSYKRFFINLINYYFLIFFFIDSFWFLYQFLRNRLFFHYRD